MLQTKFNEIVSKFMNEMEQFKNENNLDEGNIFIEIKHDSPNISGMKDGNGNVIPNIGFLSEIKFILSENY